MKAMMTGWHWISVRVTTSRARLFWHTHALIIWSHTWTESRYGKLIQKTEPVYP